MGRLGGAHGTSDMKTMGSGVVIMVYVKQPGTLNLVLKDSASHFCNSKGPSAPTHTLRNMQA